MLDGLPGSRASSVAHLRTVIIMGLSPSESRSTHLVCRCCHGFHASKPKLDCTRNSCCSTQHYFDGELLLIRCAWVVSHGTPDCRVHISPGGSDDVLQPNTYTASNPDQPPQHHRHIRIFCPRPSLCKRVQARRQRLPGWRRVRTRCPTA